MKILYCVECGAELGHTGAMRYDCPNGHIYWNNPRSATTAILVSDGLVLFGVRAHEPAKGKFDLPGGFVEHGETAEEAVIRELHEETGLVASRTEYLTSVANNYTENIHTCDEVFIILEWSGEMQAADDVERLEWREIDLIGSADFAWESYRNLIPKLKTYMDNQNVS